MNAERRKKLEEINGKILDLTQELEDLEGEEQEAFDNLPESLQGSEKGEAMQSAIDAICSAKDGLGDAEGSINEAMS